MEILAEQMKNCFSVNEDSTKMNSRKPAVYSGFSH